MVLVASETRTEGEVATSLCGTRPAACRPNRSQPLYAMLQPAMLWPVPA